MMLQVKRDPDAGLTGDHKNVEEGDGDGGSSENVDSDDTGYPNDKVSVMNFLPVKIERDDNHFKSPSAECLSSSSTSTNQELVREPDTSADFVDELDHMVLKDRLKCLLPKSCGEVKEEIRFDEQQPGVSRNQPSGTVADSFSCMPNDAVNSSGHFQKETDYSHSGCNFSIPRLNKESLLNIKLEPNNDGLLGCPSEMSSFEKFISVKSEISTACDKYEDVLDHMLLKDRMNLLSSADGNFMHDQLSKGMYKMVPFSLKSAPVGSKPALSYIGRRPWKKRRTATDSVETALEEDAPGLLRVLIEQGVLAAEIKLYGQEDIDDLLSVKETFSELEEVVEKVSWRSHSLLKLCQSPYKKGEKASYCLGFLLALVEQARYLMVRQWPVEWGWCRDLLSFIFVFERHNRIVLERPEYGYATYFFELTNTFPIDWQIKRLVTTMKLTSCSRITLLENKPLRIGEDLTLGEARVLSDFGWVPNTGLGTMLHYYDRVIHDRMFKTRKIYPSGDQRSGSCSWRATITAQSSLLVHQTQQICNSKAHISKNT